MSNDNPILNNTYEEPRFLLLILFLIVEKYIERAKGPFFIISYLLLFNY